MILIKENNSSNLAYIEGTQLIKYNDADFRRKSNCKKQGVFDYIEECALTDNHNVYKKLEYVFRDNIKWSESSYKRIDHDFQRLGLQHWNSYNCSLEDVLSRIPEKEYSEEEVEGMGKMGDGFLESCMETYRACIQIRKDRTKIFDIRSKLLRLNNWNFVIDQDVCCTQRVNVRLYGSDEYIFTEATHKEAQRLMNEITVYLNVEGNDLLIKKVHTDRALIVFSVKDGIYHACIKNGNEYDYYNDWKNDELLEQIFA